MDSPPDLPTICPVHSTQRNSHTTQYVDIGDGVTVFAGESCTYADCGCLNRVNANGDPSGNSWTLDYVSGV